MHVRLLSQVERIAVASSVMMRERRALNHWRCMMVRTAMMSTADVSDVQPVYSVAVAKVQQATFVQLFLQRNGFRLRRRFFLFSTR